MRALTAASLALMAAGVSVLALGFARWSGDDATAHPFSPVEVRPSATTTDAAEQVATSTPVAAATPTPTPYPGAVARLQIPRFEVDSAIENLGLIPGQNQLDVPKNPLNTGWYEPYDRPGFGGNAVFSAHVDYFPNIKGPFYNLHKLEAGDEVAVVMDNGLTYRYRLIRKQRYEEATIPMGELIWPTDKPNGSEWVTLITCGGRFRAYPGGNGSGYYLDRDVVVAERFE